jgi:hypothetical protein
MTTAPRYHIGIDVSGTDADVHTLTVSDTSNGRLVILGQVTGPAATALHEELRRLRRVAGQARELLLEMEQGEPRCICINVVEPPCWCCRAREVIALMDSPNLGPAPEPNDDPPTR